MVTNEDILVTLEEIEVSTPIADINVELPLVSQGFDSLDMATILLALESKYQRPIPPEKAARLRSIVEIAAYLNA